MRHDWIPSTLGHGETMCSRCFVTNREAAALGAMEQCEVLPLAVNDNKPPDREWSQDEIDEEMFTDDEHDDSEECGRWNNGNLTTQCRLAGTEWCDWSCPIGCR